MAKHTAAADPTTRRTVSCGSTRRNSASHRGHFPAMGSPAGCGGWKLAHGLDIELLPGGAGEHLLGRTYGAGRQSSAQPRDMYRGWPTFRASQLASQPKQLAGEQGEDRTQDRAKNLASQQNLSRRRSISTRRTTATKHARHRGNI